MTELNDARILVVGASGGLGRAIAGELANRGARLALSGRSEDRLRATGVDGAFVLVDLREPDAAERIVSEAEQALGGLTGVVYAAGVVAFGAVGELDEDDVDELLLLNYLAPARVAAAALPRLGAGAFVANLSAVVAEQPTMKMAAYSASKAALTAFERVARLEARRRDIRVIDIRPPHTETGLAGRPIAGSAPKLPRGLDPVDVARRIVDALAGDEADLPTEAFAAPEPMGRRG
jgi:cyclic-di-GMP-binding biofilm dispersal mediator protein